MNLCRMYLRGILYKGDFAMKNSLSEMTAFEKASIAAALTDTVTKLVSPRETGKTSSEQLADAVPKV